MPYRVIVRRAARKELVKLSEEDYARVWDAIQALANDCRPRGCIKLTNSPYWRIRIGPYRVVYEIDDGASTITVNTIGHRRDVYR